MLSEPEVHNTSTKALEIQRAYCDQCHHFKCTLHLYYNVVQLWYI